MAIATIGGHVKRAIDFYNSQDSMYFIIGGETSWVDHPDKKGTTDEDKDTPPLPKEENFRLVDIIGLKKIDSISLVRRATAEETDNVIIHNNNRWKKVDSTLSTTLAAAVMKDSLTITLASSAGFKVGSKLRVGNIYEGTIISMNGNTVTLDVATPIDIAAGTTIIGAAIVEGAKYVYVECKLPYANFPVATYRQIGLCTGVVPVSGIVDSYGILRAAKYTTSQKDEYVSIGTLEILDNRAPTPRNQDQSENLSMIIEF